MVIAHLNLVGSSTVCYSQALSITDFAFQAQATLQSTLINSDGGGLVFRAPNGQGGYRFEIGLDGSYSLSETGVSGKSSAIHTGKNPTNVLTVIAQKNLIFLYVNGQGIAQTSNGAFSQGQLGFLANGTLLPVTRDLYKRQIPRPQGAGHPGPALVKVWNL